MEKPYPAVEFEAEVGDDGTIMLPRRIAHRLRPGMQVTIRLTEGVVTKTLRSRGITEDDIEHIASLQFEGRDNVIRFLSAEGSLASSPFRARASALKKRKV